MIQVGEEEISKDVHLEPSVLKMTRNPKYQRACNGSSSRNFFKEKYRMINIGIAS